MVIVYIISAFHLGSIWFKLSLILFILFFLVILIWGVLAIFALGEYRKNKEELFQLISDVELKEINILATYKIFNKGIDVFFCDKGIVVRNSIDLRLVMFEDILKSEFLKYLDIVTMNGKLPYYLKFPLITSKKIKYLFGGQSLKIILPIDDEKKKIIVDNLREILQ